LHIYRFLLILKFKFLQNYTTKKMEKSDFLNKFSEFLQKKDILEKLLSQT